MPRLAANLSFLFTELPFLGRFKAAAEVGFKAVEFFSPYQFPPEEIAGRLGDADLTLALFNIGVGEAPGDGRGVAALPGRQDEFDWRMREALRYARVLGRPRVHVLAGIVPGGVSRATCHATFAANLRRAADMAAADGVGLLIEPLNARDNPGYALRTTAEAMEILEAVDRDNVRLQLDLYHLQVTEGDLACHIEKLAPSIGHVQIAGNPGRHEPSIGEVNYPYLLERLDAVGYRSWVGCEYRPLAGTVEGLAWARPYGIGPGSA